VTNGNHQRASGVLAGVRILDLTRVVSGAVATMLLADPGAEIIKVEPPAGDVYRNSGPKVPGPGGVTPLNFLRFLNAWGIPLDEIGDAAGEGER
jgi:crotonobetainyl-CoA:carnitine CoA-transferase CaiB-like acyl-CoA transferase